MEYYTTASKHSTNTSTACDTTNIKSDITDTWYTLSLCGNFQNFFLFWISCDTPSIKIDTAEQQVARHNQPNIYIHTTNRQQNTLISTTSGETFNTITQIRKIKITRYILAPLQLMSTYYKTCIIHPINLVTM